MTFWQFLTLLYARWKSESPALFQKITNFGVTLVSVGMSMIAVPAIPNVTLPDWIAAIGKYMVIAGTCIGFVAKLTCQDPTKLDTSANPPTTNSVMSPNKQ